MMLFTLADRWGEPDPRKLAALPANIITYWEAYFGILKGKSEAPSVISTKPPVPAAPKSQSDQQFADCFRILGNGC